jgi:hypothetical protein
LDGRGFLQRSVISITGHFEWGYAAAQDFAFAIGLRFLQPDIRLAQTKK